MNFAFFYHSLLSDWNHGNAHFLRGIVSDLQQRGHQVTVYEPENSWSLQNLRAEHADAPIRSVRAAYPNLESRRYSLESFDLKTAIQGMDVVVVHEWNAPALVSRLSA